MDSVIPDIKKFASNSIRYAKNASPLDQHFHTNAPNALLVRLVKRCEKPDRKEFIKVATKTATGFLIVGAIGFVVKLVFIPINQVC